MEQKTRDQKVEELQEIRFRDSRKARRGILPYFLLASMLGIGSGGGVVATNSHYNNRIENTTDSQIKIELRAKKKVMNYLEN